MVFYTVDKVAEMLDVHPVTVRRWIDKGKLKAFRPTDDGSSKYKIRKEDFEKFISDRMN